VIIYFTVSYKGSISAFGAVLLCLIKRLANRCSDYDGFAETDFYTIFPCFCVQDMDIRFINSRENVLAFIFAGQNFLSGQCNYIVHMQR